MGERADRENDSRAKLRQAIEREVAQAPFESLLNAVGEVTGRYRSAGKAAGRLLRSEIERLAYAATRMPATFAAGRAALLELKLAAPGLEVKSMLDLGSGPGTMAWAALDIFPGIERLTLVERDPGMIELGRRLCAGTGVEKAEWVRADIAGGIELPGADLVVASYSLGELPDRARKAVCGTMAGAAGKALLLIEPGTVRGFGAIREAREWLLAEDFDAAAPCPHNRACPMQGDDWCHFPARVERSSLHRRLKSGALGYEDEKFSYVALTRGVHLAGRSRVLRHPAKHSGFIEFTLCTGGGIERSVITRSDPGWKSSRKSGWGDALEIHRPLADQDG